MARIPKAPPARLRDDAAVPARGPVAPRILDPILALAEWIDRRARRITPVQAGAVLAVERHRYRGRPFSLADGTALRPGDRADIIHFINVRVRKLAEPGVQAAALSQGRADLRALAARVAATSPHDRPAAFRGATILSAYARRLGFEQRPRTPSPWHRLEDWYLRSMLARWAPDGRRRMRAGHSSLVVSEVWISVPELLRRFGPSAGAAAARDAEGSDRPRRGHGAPGTGSD